jgi:hypothetical protein
MTYSDKVNASNTIKTAILTLEDNGKVKVSYGTDSDNMPIVYVISCNVYGNRSSYSIYKDDVFGLRGMNIDTIGKTSMEAYTYDMMGQRSSYRFPLYELKLVN